MLHPNNMGIYCDLCGKEILIKDDLITYYSINMKKVLSHKNLPKEITDTLDLDFCEECHQILYDRVYKVSIINNKKREKYGRKHV